MPSTTSATIIMVAKTGRLIETSERNIAWDWGLGDWGLGIGDWECRGTLWSRRPGARWSGRLPQPRVPSPQSLLCLSAHDRHLHPRPQGADVPDHHAVALGEPAQHLGDAGRLVGDADLHGH